MYHFPQQKLSANFHNLLVTRYLLKCFIRTFRNW